MGMGEKDMTKLETLGEVSIVLDSQAKVIDRHDSQIAELLKVTNNLVLVQKQASKTMGRFIAGATTIILFLITLLISSQISFLNDYRKLIHESGNRGINQRNTQPDSRDLQPTDNENKQTVKPVLQAYIKQDNPAFYIGRVLYYPN